MIGIREANTSAETAVYDPTCGSGSLLLKVGDEAKASVTLYGQEKDAATSGLARMNMILHNYPTATISQGNTLTEPKYKTGEALKQFDFVVANPPFSDKRWRTGLILTMTPMDGLNPLVCRPTVKAIMLTCCISSAHSRALVRGPAFCPMACSSAAIRKRKSGAT